METNIYGNDMSELEDMQPDWFPDMASNMDGDMEDALSGLLSDNPEGDPSDGTILDVPPGSPLPGFPHMWGASAGAANTTAPTATSWSPSASMAPLQLVPQQQVTQAGGMHPSTCAVPAPALEDAGFGGSCGPLVNGQLLSQLAAMSPQQQQALAQCLAAGGGSLLQALPGAEQGMYMPAGSEVLLQHLPSSQGMLHTPPAPTVLGAAHMVTAAPVLAPPLPSASAAEGVASASSSSSTSGRCILVPADWASLQGLAQQLAVSLLKLQPGGKAEHCTTAAMGVEYPEVNGTLQQGSLQEAAVACLVGLQQWQMALAALGWQPPPRKDGVRAATSSYHNLLAALGPQVRDWAPQDAPPQPILWWVPSALGTCDKGAEGDAPRSCSYTSYINRILVGDEALCICRMVAPIQVLDQQQQEGQGLQDAVLYLVPVQVDAPKPCQAFMLGLRVEEDGTPMEACPEELQRYPRLLCAPLLFDNAGDNWRSFWRKPSKGKPREGQFWYGRIMGLLDWRPPAV